MDDLLKYLPWALFGLLIVFGGVVTAFAGLPFATKRDIEAVNKELDHIHAIQATTAEQLAQTTVKLAVLTANVSNLAEKIRENGRNDTPPRGFFP